MIKAGMLPAPAGIEIEGVAASESVKVPPTVESDDGPSTIEPVHPPPETEPRISPTPAPPTLAIGSGTDHLAAYHQLARHLQSHGNVIRTDQLAAEGNGSVSLYGCDSAQDCTFAAEIRRIRSSEDEQGEWWEARITRPQHDHAPQAAKDAPPIISPSAGTPEPAPASPVEARVSTEQSHVTNPSSLAITEVSAATTKTIPAGTPLVPALEPQAEDVMDVIGAASTVPVPIDSTSEQDDVERPTKRARLASPGMTIVFGPPSLPSVEPSSFDQSMQDWHAEHHTNGPWHAPEPAPEPAAASTPPQRLPRETLPSWSSFLSALDPTLVHLAPGLSSSAVGATPASYFSHRVEDRPYLLDTLKGVISEWPRVSLAVHLERKGQQVWDGLVRGIELKAGEVA